MASELRLSEDYRENVRRMDEVFSVEENFDLIKKVISVGTDEMTLYYIDGFVKDGSMTKILIYILGLKGLGKGGAEAFMRGHMPYVEAEVTQDGETITRSLLSGATVMLGSTFGGEALIVDARTYPARDTAEPEGDLVMRGARDGFVETLIYNTTLIRRRIRNPALTMHYLSVGRSSQTDVCVCYMKDRADLDYVDKIKRRLGSIQADALPMGQESLMESLVKRQWYNPFPKVRTTERPDTAAAQLLEGSVLILCDNSPQVMVLPTSMLDFLQETNDYYFPPLTGSYIRITRQIIFWLALFFTPFWYLMVKNPNVVPGFLAFMQPQETGKIPIIAQLLLVEFLIDGLRMASLNTPNMLSNSLSVVGGLILGDFAVDIGWLIPEVILYMAFVAIANFTQRSYELGYAVKFLRIVLLILTALFDVWGFVGGVALILALLATNRGVDGERGYLYPIIPFRPRALRTLLFRTKKTQDVPAAGPVSDR